MKSWIAVAVLALVPGFSNAGPIDHGWYTESGGLHWLDINLSSSDHGSGWRLATLAEFSSLAGDFGSPDVDPRSCEAHGWAGCDWNIYGDWGTKQAIVMLTSQTPDSSGCQPDHSVSCFEQRSLAARLADDPDLNDDEPFGLFYWQFERWMDGDDFGWQEFRSGVISGPGGYHGWSPDGYDGSFMVRASDWTDVPIPAPASLLLFSLIGLLPLMRRQS